jgi:hypothetical protein
VSTALGMSSIPYPLVPTMVGMIVISSVPSVKEPIEPDHRLRVGRCLAGRRLSRLGPALSECVRGHHEYAAEQSAVGDKGPFMRSARLRVFFAPETVYDQRRSDQRPG